MLDENSGKFKLAVGMRDECCFCGIFPVLSGWLVGMAVFTFVDIKPRMQHTRYN